MARVLDACCGSKMFWFNKSSEDVVYMDNREVETTLCDGRRLEIKPDIVADFRDMPFADGIFSLDPFYVDPLQDVVQNISGFWNWSYIGMEKSKINGNKAILPIKVHDTKKNIEQTINVAMEKENGVWRVKSIANMEEIYRKYMGE